MNTKRLYKFDNARFFLMFFVILGHFLEITKGYGNNTILYHIIYSFHMPAFIFISGYFAKYQPKKIIFYFIFPYIIFQFLYQLFDFQILNTSIDKQLAFQFTTPYWILWYLFVMILYYLLIPFINTDKNHIQYMILGSSIVLSLLIGYDASIGYYLSLSRFFTFLPFFVSGYYAGHDDTIKGRLELYAKKWWFRILITVGICFACFYIWNSKNITASVLYGSCSYAAADYGIFTKLMLLIIAFLWTAFLFFILFNTNKKIFLISHIGSNTFPIFLLHGFFIKLIEKSDFLTHASTGNLLWVFLFTFVIMILLGNSLCASVFHILFMDNLIVRVLKK